VPLDIAGTTVSANRLIAFAFALVIGLVLYLALTRTRGGTAVRAVAVDPRSARLVGIDVARTSALAFALGGALCAVAGVLISMFLTFSASGGVLFTMKALIVVILGGVGSLLGTLVAGLVLGLSEIAVARLVDPGLTLAVNYVLFLAILLVRPTGIFGSSAR
jgi:branched-chain amino acid transport system permease protein